MDEKCECHIISGHKLHNDGSLSNTFTISYCPLHAAAEQLLEALRAVEWVDHFIDNDGYDDRYIIICPWCYEEDGHGSGCPRQAAIAAASPDSYQAEPEVE